MNQKVVRPPSLTRYICADMTPFKLFPKISATAYSPDAAQGGTWVALEKIHGAQLVIAVSSREVKFGKRKAWLEDSDPFFGWQLIRHKLTDAARTVHQAVGIHQSVVTIYGELFGGAYPHPSVASIPGMAPVQTGIWYAPELHYAVFDIHVSQTADVEGEFLSHSEVTTLTKGASLLMPPVLKHGQRQMLEQLPVRFATQVPAMFGLPSIENNWAEGYVLKADARSTLSSRAILKRKIPEFDEAVFDESTPWNPDQSLSLEELMVWSNRLVNTPRVASARSKWGDTKTDQIVEEIILDVMVDIELAFPKAFRSLNLEEEERLRSRIRGLVTSFLNSGL